MRRAWLKLAPWNKCFITALVSAAILAEEGSLPETLQRKVFVAADPFFWQQSENLELVHHNGKPAIRLERKFDPAPPFDDVVLDFDQPGLMRNPAHQSLLVSQNLIRRATTTLSKHAGQFSLPQHGIRLLLPDYLHFSGNDSISGDFSFFCEIEPESADATLLYRENFFAGRQFLFSIVLRNNRVIVQLENLLYAHAKETEYFENLTLRSMDKIRSRKRNQLLLTYREAEGKIALYLNGREQASQILPRDTKRHFVLRLSPLKKAPLLLFSPYRGYADNVIFTNRLLLPQDAPDFGALKPYGDRYQQRTGRFFSKIFDFGYSQSYLVRIDATKEQTNENALELGFRCTDRRYDPGTDTTHLPIQPLHKAAGMRCRFVQLSALFRSDNAGETSPLLKKVVIEFRPNPPPARPQKLKILSVQNETLEAEIQPNNEPDVINGGRYMLYYGHVRYKPEGAVYFRDFNSSGEGIPIAHAAPFRIKVNNDTLAKNKQWADQDPRFKLRYPLFSKGIGFYFWITACDNAWSTAEEHSDHCSLPSEAVFARFD
ncbi:MAG: hypothetical protein NZL89_01165 [Leptospiraceae bacterium]|nr:hypothetical protein [Leptospiraceae bacterium]